MLNHIHIQTPDTFSENFVEFSANRLEASRQLMIVKSKQYTECHNERSRLLKAVREALGPENFKLLLMLDEACGHVLSMETDAAYVQGLRDGARLKDILSRGLEAVYPGEGDSVTPERAKVKNHA